MQIQGIQGETKRKRLQVTKLTSIVQSSGDGCNGPCGAVLGHTTVCLHSECVIQMGVQVSDYDCIFLQVCRTWLKADLLSTRDTRHHVTVLARHTVGKITAAAGHQW